jgi:hypothetical protein
MTQFLIGPVNGKVTTSTARVRIEVDGDVPIKCSLTPEGGAAVVREVTPVPGRAAVIPLVNLQPGADPGVWESGFRTRRRP